MITSGMIKNLLAQKHSKDVFVEECKSGPSMAHLLILDGWAMKKSWANPCYTGYEIKVSRSDFLADTKWPGYLDLCNEFYFVAPKDVIKPIEVPEKAGFLQVAKTGTRLFTKKKAPYREIEEPVALLLYILMARTEILSCQFGRSISNRDYFENWLADKKSKLEIGTKCSEKLKQSYRKQVYDVGKEIKELRRENKKYEAIKNVCERLNVNINWHCFPEKEVARQVENLRKTLPDGINRTVDKLIKDLSEFREKIKEQ